MLSDELKPRIWSEAERAEWLADKICVGDYGSEAAELLRKFAAKAETHAVELRAYEATVQNLEQRIRELEAQRVPEGWKLVPIYPTSDMLSAFDHCDAQGCQFAETYWDAMLAAAPKKEGE